VRERDPDESRHQIALGVDAQDFVGVVTPVLLDLRDEALKAAALRPR
jgi:hypothetical protein